MSADFAEESFGTAGRAEVDRHASELFLPLGDIPQRWGSLYGTVLAPSPRSLHHPGLDRGG